MGLKLIFMGTPEFAVPILRSIHESEHKILCVYTQPPQKKNRGQKINPYDRGQFFCTLFCSQQVPRRYLFFVLSNSTKIAEIVLSDSTEVRCVLPSTFMHASGVVI